MTNKKPELEVVAEPAGGEGPAAPPTAQELGLELSENSPEARDQLLTAVHEARVEASKRLDGMLRAMAELENNKKRALNERILTLNQAGERIVSRLLPVLDSFEAALEGEGEAESNGALNAGMKNTLSQLKDALAAEGLQEIPSVGESFDPEVHEAVSTLGEADDLVVLHELRKGYVLKTRVLRPTTVVVGPRAEAS
jgi:molecular chaperone GrpE